MMDLEIFSLFGSFISGGRSYSSKHPNKTNTQPLCFMLRKDHAQIEKPENSSQRTFGTFASPIPHADASACKRAKF